MADAVFVDTEDDDQLYGIGTYTQRYAFKWEDLYTELGTDFENEEQFIDSLKLEKKFPKNVIDPRDQNALKKFVPCRTKSQMIHNGYDVYFCQYCGATPCSGIFSKVEEHIVGKGTTNRAKGCREYRIWKRVYMESHPGEPEPPILPPLLLGKITNKKTGALPPRPPRPTGFNQ